MEIVVQSHHAAVSERTVQRARRAVAAFGEAHGELVDATIRFEKDNPHRRVELVIRATRRRTYVAEGTARFYGPALNQALTRIEAQILERLGRTRARARKLAKA